MHPAIKAVCVGFGAALAIILMVFATGQTFGQRCEKLYPHGTPAQIEMCVSTLSGR